MIRFRLISLLLGLWTILAGLPASAQNREVTGTVSDEAGPVVGATVIVKGSSVGTTTDANGSYRIEVPGTDAVLVFSFVGYETLELSVGSKTRVDAKFAQTSVEVEELVVVGYGVQRKSHLTGAITKFNPQDVIDVPSSDITFSYFDGSSVVSFVHSGAEIVREVPKVDQLTPSGTVEVGTDITATGSFLHLVEQIKVGDVEARIVSQPENGQSLTFRILDDPSFPDGVNTLPLVFYSFNGSEVLDVQEQFSFLVPKFYTWRNANLNAHSVQKLNHFFCLDTGETYSADDFAEKVDPLTMSLGGGVCVAKNVLSPEVTAEQYYAVKPYIFFAYLGSGCYFYGAANNNNRLSNFKTSSGSALLTSGQAYGTPIILYRTLCEAEPAEKALIDKIKGGNFTNDDFSADLLDGIDLESKGSDTPDGWSNVPNGEFGAYKAPSESNHRPWAPALTSATETVDMNPGTVVLVMYFQPNWEEGFSVDKANIRKFGFIEITRLVQDKSVESGRQNNATFNVYWQRTPMGD